jgi:ethanolamine utilization protein EutQ (cupin superfamily)
MDLVLKKAKEIVTEPLEAGDTKINLVDMIGGAENAPVQAGIGELWASSPIDFVQDSHAVVCYMLEGQVTLTEGDTRLEFEPGDILFLPHLASLTVTWETQSHGKWFYVTYPHWR